MVQTSTVGINTQMTEFYKTNQESEMSSYSSYEIVKIGGL